MCDPCHRVVIVGHHGVALAPSVELKAARAWPWLRLNPVRQQRIDAFAFQNSCVAAMSRDKASSYRRFAAVDEVVGPFADPKEHVVRQLVGVGVVSELDSDVHVGHHQASHPILIGVHAVHADADAV